MSNEFFYWIRWILDTCPLLDTCPNLTMSGEFLVKKFTGHKPYPFKIIWKNKCLTIFKNINKKYIPQHIIIAMAHGTLFAILFLFLTFSSLDLGTLSSLIFFFFFLSCIYLLISWFNLSPLSMLCSHWCRPNTFWLLWDEYCFIILNWLFWIFSKCDFNCIELFLWCCQKRDVLYIQKNVTFITFSQQIICGKLFFILIWIHNLNYFLSVHNNQ